ncbi:MAG TPA: hypothetical protein VJP02_09395 [Candidatus Sulfotelmatobacter sp.]|nr:hypothetical protein [Candidatus Sulfotelmatobacter sp.]
MRWAFWRRNKKKNNEAPELIDALEKNTQCQFPLFTPTSTSELLGLQRLIGNQAVLRMLHPPSSGGTTS